MLKAVIGILAVTAILFMLPLSQGSNEVISVAALLVLFLSLEVAQVMAARRTRGIDRFVWIAFVVTDVLLFLAFSIDTSTDAYLPTREALPIPFLLAPLSAIASILLLLILARRVVRDTNWVALAADAVWLSIAATVILWPTVLDPVLHLGADRVTIATILLQGLVVSALAGTFGALILRSAPGTRWSMVETGIGIVAIRAAVAVFNWGWVRDGIELGSRMDFLALTLTAAMTWTALRAPEAARRLRGANPEVRELLAASWIPIVVFVASLSVQTIGSDGHEAALIVAASVVLFARLSVELRQSGRLREALHDLASTDALTRLPNRMTLEGAVQAAGETMTAVMIIDLDRFKIVNDQLGLEVGDELLRQVAGRLREALDDTWLLARVGGDEFIAITRSPISQQEGVRLGEQLIEAITPSFTIRGSEAWIGASIGLATLDDGIESHELRSVADLALRQAKKAGRGEVVVSDGSLRGRAGDAVEFAEGLQRGVDAEQFFCLYQPKVDLFTGELVGVEALVRWDHPDRGVLAPAQFLDVAEATGLIARIDQSVLRQAVSQLARWNLTFPDRRLGLSVNMSAWELARQDIADDVALTLAAPGATVDPSQIVVELTETVLIDDPLVVRRRLERLRSTGINVSVDDFGAGFTSVAHLREFPISEVKIDRSLVAELREDGSDARSVARAVVALAQALELEVISEGIESMHQVQALSGFGCRVGQGFLFSPPVPADKINEWLAADAPFLDLVSP